MLDCSFKEYLVAHPSSSLQRVWSNIVKIGQDHIQGNIKLMWLPRVIFIVPLLLSMILINLILAHFYVLSP